MTPELVNNTGRDLVSDCGYKLMMYSQDYEYPSNLVAVEGNDFIFKDNPQWTKSIQWDYTAYYRYTDGAVRKDYNVKVSHVYETCADQVEIVPNDRAQDIKIKWLEPQAKNKQVRNFANPFQVVRPKAKRDYLMNNIKFEVVYEDGSPAPPWV